MEPERDKNNNRFWTGVLTGAAAAVLILGGVWGAGRILDFGDGDFTSENVSEADVEEKLDQLEGLIEDYYLYEDEVDKDALIEGIYTGYAGALGDPYTEYYDEEETKALQESTSGEFSGIGATMSQDAETGVITVVNVYKGSPAEKAGILEGDILSGVDGRSTDGQDLENVVSWIKGEQGTEVSVVVVRDGEEVEMTAVRDIIEVQTVEYEMKAGQVGYISVSEFDSVTYDQFKTALKIWKRLEWKGL